MSDSCFALFGVHLFGYHVIPLFILDTGTCAWPHSHRGPGRFRSLHISGRLGIVSLSQLSLDDAVLTRYIVVYATLKYWMYAILAR